MSALRSALGQPAACFLQCCFPPFLSFCPPVFRFSYFFLSLFLSFLLSFLHSSLWGSTLGYIVLFLRVIAPTHTCTHTHTQFRDDKSPARFHRLAGLLSGDSHKCAKACVGVGVRKTPRVRLGTHAEGQRGAQGRLMPVRVLHRGSARVIGSRGPFFCIYHLRKRIGRKHITCF